MKTAIEPATTKAIHAPCVHLNGTGRAQLVSAYEVAYDAIAAAFKAVRDTAPNGRDYYTSPGTMEQAQDEHRSRLLALNNLQNEFDAIIGGIEARHTIVMAQIDT